MAPSHEGGLRMKIACFICKNELDINDSYCYRGKTRRYTKTTPEDYKDIPRHVVNTASRTDVIFVCAACYEKKKGG